ncbi:MAG TPA: HYR domain-containing protein [Thermoanaerobaculia bacterium]|nr:HYR domain-containing protein [Thermoanaerobaculia bacterium]
MRKLLVALFLLFPVVAAAQITISPSRIAYNTEGQILTVSGSFRPGTAATLVDFTFTDGGVAEVLANTANSENITAEVPLSVTDQPGLWTVSVVFIDNDETVRTDGSATLTIFANLPPIINVPEVVTAEATSAAGAVVNFADLVNGFSFVDPPPAPVISCTPASGTTFALGTTTVSCTATDSFGSSHGSFKVFVGDTTGPVITVPAPFTTTNPVSYSVTAVDAVDGARPVTCSPASGTTFPAGVTTVQCSSSDLSDNESFASFQVSVGVPPAPTLTLPGNMTVIADNTSGIGVAYDVSADQDATVVCSPASGAFFPIGTTTVHCTATNIFGGSSTGSFTITVISDPRPRLTLPADITVSPTSPAGAVVTYVVTATDSVDGTFNAVCTPVSGFTFPIGRNAVECTATNSRGYSSFGTFFVIVIDVTPPVLHLPTAVNVPSSGNPAGTEVNYTATATDNVDGDVAITCDPPTGSLFPDGVTVVQCRAFDSSGNLATGSFNVTVGDTQPPVITAPGSVTAEATGPSGAVVTFVVTANDNFDGPVAVTCAPPSGSLFALGTTQVTCTAHDTANNMATLFFNVNVVDTTPPALHLPSDITVNADASCSATVSYTATATDLVDGNVSVTCTPPSGSSFALGTTTVNCSATDAHHNTAHGSFHVTVQDVTPPTIQSVTATPNNLWPDNHKMVAVGIAVVAVDNCDTAPVNRIVSVTSNQPINGPGDGNTNPDYVITGDLTLQLRAERTANQDRTYTITVTSTDASGNTSTATVTVTVAQTARRRAS